MQQEGEEEHVLAPTHEADEAALLSLPERLGIAKAKKAVERAKQAAKQAVEHPPTTLPERLGVAKAKTAVERAKQAAGRAQEECLLERVGKARAKAAVREYEQVSQENRVPNSSSASPELHM
jgi:hypothetical protein